MVFRQDIHSVKKQYNIGGVQKHADDHISVETWIAELGSMGDENPVLLYRRVDSLISILLRVARDKAFERIIKVEKNSSSKKVNDINK